MDKHYTPIEQGGRWYAFDNWMGKISMKPELGARETRQECESAIACYVDFYESMRDDFVLESRTLTDDTGYILRRNKRGKYMTHFFNEDGTTVSGHYFASYADALKDLTERVKRRGLLVRQSYTMA